MPTPLSYVVGRGGSLSLGAQGVDTAALMSARATARGDRYQEAEYTVVAQPGRHGLVYHVWRISREPFQLPSGEVSVRVRKEHLRACAFHEEASEYIGALRAGRRVIAFGRSLFERRPISQPTA